MSPVAAASPRRNKGAQLATRGRGTGVGGRWGPTPVPRRPTPRRGVFDALFVETTALLAAILLPALVLGGCASWGRPIGLPLRNKTRFASEWKDYEAMPAFKSLAVAGNLDGIYVSGWTSEYCEQEKATADALKYCEQRRRERRIGGACRVYAIGDRILSRR